MLLSSDSGPTLDAFKAKIRRYASGELSHAEPVLPELYELMESDVTVGEAPLPAAATSDQQVMDGDWDGLKWALTSSLTSGTFLDSQFYAVEPRSSNIRPIYFCSEVGHGFTSNLTARRSLLE